MEASSPRGSQPPSGTRRLAPTPPKAHAVPAGYAQIGGWAGAAPGHRIIRSPTAIRRPRPLVSRIACCSDPPPNGRPPLPHRRVKVRARLSARRPDSGTEPAKGGAGRGRCSGRGGAEGAGGRADPPEGGTCSAPRGGWTGEGSPAAGPASPRRTKGTHFYLPIATSREVAPLGEGAFSSLRTRRGRGTPGSKRDPGVLAPRYPRTKGLRLQPRHLHEPSCAHLSSSQRADLAQRGSGTAGG